MLYHPAVEVVSNLAKAPRPRHFHALLFRFLVLGGLLLACAMPAAQVKLDSLRAGSRTYRNVTVLGVNATDIYFTHEGGITSVRLKYLEAKLQKRFHYDPEAAAEAERQQATDDALYMESVASNMVAQAQQAALAAQKAAATSEDSLADPVSEKSLIGKPAPAIKGGKWLGEKPALEGKIVLVAFWAPWSIPCRKYIPELNALQKKFAGKLAVVGVTSESEAEIADLTEPKIEFASVIDPKAKFGATVGVMSIPYVLLIDSKGIVRYQGHPTAITEKVLENILAKTAE
jgi:cytochrome c biogenesis protein CcmG/thiol:disulfide interchange protein DsbE